MCEREPCAEIVQSGTWLYDNLIPYEVWIVKQNFEYWYEPDYANGPEELNSDGEAFQIVIAQSGRLVRVGPARLSLHEAIAAAEEICSSLTWTNHVKQKLFGGYSTTPLAKD